MARRSRNTELYPALAAWQRRDGGKPHSRWTYDGQWRAAMAEAEARECQHNAQREQQYQIDAVLALLYGKQAGDPPQKRYPKVVLDVETQRRYAQRIREFEQGMTA